MSINQAAVKFVVDGLQESGRLSPIWRSFGYDEINWTYTPRGKRIFRTIGRLSSQPYYIRCHHTLTSGNGLSTPTKGSGDVCHRGEGGQLQFNFELLDQVFETFLENNCRPIVELGFMPDVLSKGPTPKLTYDYSGTGLWRYPPKDYDEWQEVVFETVRHCVEKYGREEVSTWYWEVWNEPDTPGFFKGTVKDYCRLYDYAVAGAVRAFENVKIGGPALAHNVKFLDKFLKHCCGGKNRASGERGTRLDFISLHAKGNGWPLFGQPFEMPSLRRIMSQLENYHQVIRNYPALCDVEILLDECDMAVATNYGVYDFPEFEMNNSEYYPVFVIRMAKSILDFTAERRLPAKLFTTWAYYFEGKRFFEGNRALFTNENIKKPIFSAFTMFEKLGETRLKLERIQTEVGLNSQAFPQTDGLASLCSDGSLAILLWNFDENVNRRDVDTIQLEIKNIPVDSERVLIERFQIDAQHSNSHAVWQELGAPQNPSTEQLRKIQEREVLEKVESTESRIEMGKVFYSLNLPLSATCLIRISPRLAESKALD